MSTFANSRQQTISVLSVDSTMKFVAIMMRHIR